MNEYGDPQDNVTSGLGYNNVSNSTNGVADDLDCPVYDESDEKLLDFFSFWVAGVLQTLFAILGILGNTIASIIISRKEMRNSFNLLLVSLACFDSTYLFGSILESFRKDFGIYTDTHILLFPYFLYPINQVRIFVFFLLYVYFQLVRSYDHVLFMW